MTSRLITIKIDAGETTCDKCRGIDYGFCRHFRERLHWGVGVWMRLPECLASEVKERGNED